MRPFGRRSCLLAPLLALAAFGVGGCGASRASNPRPAPPRPVLGPRESFTGTGVFLRPPLASARAEARSDGLPTAASAIAAARHDRAVRGFVDAVSRSSLLATLQTVRENLPTTKAIRPGSSYQAWVITFHGPSLSTGGPYIPPGDRIHSHAIPPSLTACLNVDVYDLSLRQWTEQIQTCR